MIFYSLRLTDEEAKKNWMEHGNPDGPGATTFGIALPKWIVERENSVWVSRPFLYFQMCKVSILYDIWEIYLSSTCMKSTVDSDIPQAHLLVIYMS